MKFADIVEEWNRDKDINYQAFTDELGRHGKLLSKYQEHYLRQREIQIGHECEFYRVEKRLRDYYSGLCGQHELDALNRSQFLKRIAKSEIQTHIESDDLWIDQYARVERAKARVKYLEQVLSYIQFDRRKELEHYLDYLKWTGGLQ